MAFQSQRRTMLSMSLGAQNNLGYGGLSVGSNMAIGGMYAPVQDYPVFNPAVRDSMMIQPSFQMSARDMIQNHMTTHMQPSGHWNVNQNIEARVPPTPNIIVFVGNITDVAPECWIEPLLKACGPVFEWKRVQGSASGLHGTFGFCEYADPESALRAIRLLHGQFLGSKKLMVKVDDKAKGVLERYKAARSANSAFNDKMRQEDLRASEQIASFIRRAEITLRQLEADKTRKKDSAKAEEIRPSKKTTHDVKTKSIEVTSNFTKGCDGLKDMDIEDDTKQLIQREIGKFRGNVEKYERAKEKETARKEMQKKRYRKEGREWVEEGFRKDSHFSVKMSNRIKELTKGVGNPVTANITTKQLIGGDVENNKMKRMREIEQKCEEEEVYERIKKQKIFQEQEEAACEEEEVYERIKKQKIFQEQEEAACEEDLTRKVVLLLLHHDLTSKGPPLTEFMKDLLINTYLIPNIKY